MHQSARLLEQGKEQCPVHRVAPESGVDATARTPQRTKRSRRHALQFGVTLQQRETFEQGARLAFEHVFRHHVEQLAARLEAFVDLLHGFVGDRKQGGRNVLQQDGVELRDHLRAAVIALHEDFGRPARGCGLHAECRCQGLLMIEDQSVLATACDVMQACACVAHEALDAMQLTRLGRRDQAARGQFRPGRTKAAGTRHPLDHLQVAQTARAFLAVGLEAVRRFLVALMAFLLLQSFRLEKVLRIALIFKRGRQLAKKAARAGKPDGLRAWSSRL